MSHSQRVPASDFLMNRTAKPGMRCIYKSRMRKTIPATTSVKEWYGSQSQTDLSCHRKSGELRYHELALPRSHNARFLKKNERRNTKMEQKTKRKQQLGTVHGNLIARERLGLTRKPA